MDYESFKEKLFARAGEYGFTDCELYYSASKNFSVRVFGGEINEYENTESIGASFRGTYGGRVGYAFTEKLDESVIEGLVVNAAGNAAIIEEEEIEKLFEGCEAYPEVKNYNDVLEKYSAAEKIETATAMEKYAFSLDGRIVSVDYCGVETGEDEVRISNSYGLDLHDRSNFAAAYVLPRAVEDGVTKTGFELWHGNDLAEFSYEAAARTAVGRALSSLGAKSAESGDYKIVFENRSAVYLLACFSSVFFAENAQKGFSLLKGKTGETIANETVTLRDDGVCGKSFKSPPFDSEGVATQNKAVIENGVLKTLLYNLKSAAKDGAESTGNGFKPNYGGTVATSCTNFYLAPSETPFDKMLEEAGSGILITDLAGLHSGSNTVSGDFSFSADGFMIENGKKGRPVEQITVAGNFFELLKNIVIVASDLKFSPPGNSGSFGTPSFLVSGLRVSGL